MIIPFARRALPFGVALAAAVGGSVAALHYHRLGLTLSHYDARGHLVVARRIFDSITPGWQQIGAVWLPLPHLLNAIPVQIDVFYRSGAAAVAVSIVAFAIACGAIASIVLSLTNSATAAVAAAAVFGLNPNVLYLQSTPMTEPLLIALTALLIAVLIASSERLGVTFLTSSRGPTRDPQRGSRVGGPAPATCAERAVARSALLATTVRLVQHQPSPTSTRLAVTWLLVLCCLTRYEAWPVTVFALAATVWTLWRRGERFIDAIRSVGAVALYPAIAIAAFAIFSRVVIGEWLIASGFFVPENKALNDPVMAAAEIWWGARMLSGGTLVALGAAGAAALLAVGLVDRNRPEALAALALAATAIIPWAAFLKGHPFRIRYMVPLIAIEAVGAGVLAGLVKRAQLAAALIVIAIALYELRPLDGAAPMVMEAQWDRPNVPARARVTACLPRPGSGEKIMASMGSLGHYMQETSRAGYSIRDFLHEGNGDIWLVALESPQPFVRWILIEEKAEGGDVLARRARDHPMFLDGYARVCEGAGLVLYRRRDNGVE